jgi:hypothetical protein
LHDKQISLLEQSLTVLSIACATWPIVRDPNCYKQILSDGYGVHGVKWTRLLNFDSGQVRHLDQGLAARDHQGTDGPRPTGDPATQAIVYSKG